MRPLTVRRLSIHPDIGTRPVKTIPRDIIIENQKAYGNKTWGSGKLKCIPDYPKWLPGLNGQKMPELKNNESDYVALFHVESL